MNVTRAGATKDAVFEALLEELQHNRLTQTEYIEQLRSQVVNHVLACELVKFDATGQVTRGYGTPYGSVAVANHSTTGDVTVHASGPGASAPGTGPSIGFVKKATAAVLNLTGHALTLYGTAGESCTVQVFTKAQPPAFGPA